jgi:hypothetical protein
VIEHGEYDLCPLIASRTELQVNILEDIPPTQNKKKYTLGLKGPLKIDPTLPSDLQCEDGTWICLTGEFWTIHISNKPTKS